jgi:hypothetical protein
LFESGTQGILSSIASCMSSRLEHDPQVAIAVEIHLDDYTRRAGLSEPDLYSIIARRLIDAGIRCAERDDTAGCVLGAEVQLEDGGLCVLTLEFFRVGELWSGGSTRGRRGGAWRLTLLAHAPKGEAIKSHLSPLVGEFIRQYMEAN